MTDIVSQPAAPPIHPLAHPAKREDPTTGFMLPVDLEDSIALRRHLNQRHMQNPAAQAEQMARCSRSVLYWVNWWVWTFVIRKYGPDGRLLPIGKYDAHVPFISWPCQDAAIAQVMSCISEGRDVLVDKSRDMGASWLLVAIAAWHWLFIENAQIGCCARIEDDVDKVGDPKSLFWKFDYLLSRLPEWMLPEHISELIRGGKYGTDLIRRNPKNGSVLRGEATTEHMFRGDRLHFVIFDEMAAHQNAAAGWTSAADSTACRIANSTPIGPGTEYSRLWQQGIVSGNPKVVTLGYEDHPDKGQGRVWRVDKDGALTGTAGRGYWDNSFFREEVQRRTTQDLCQNLLRDHIASGDLLFNAPLMQQHMMAHRVDPVRCEVIEGKLKPVDNGRWYIYCGLKQLASMRSNFCIGMDPSHGKGKANSAASVIARRTGRIVAEFCDPFVDGFELADEVIEAGKTVFSHQSDAFVIWETNGPGESIYKRFQERKYHNVYFQRETGKRTQRPTREYGWRSDKKRKRVLLNLWAQLIYRGEVEVPSARCLTESLEYVYFENGSVGPGHLADEKTGAEMAHGDLVIACALAVMGMRQAAVFEDERKKMDPNSIGKMLGADKIFSDADERFGTL